MEGLSCIYHLEERRFNRSVFVIQPVINCASQVEISSGGSFVRLKECPNSPNCVSSQTDKQSHKVQPFSYVKDIAPLWKEIEKLLLGISGVALVEKKHGYIHVTFTTPILRFVDDLELLLDAEKRLIHVRSASRVGYYDLGANAKRVEKLRQLFLSKGLIVS